MSEFATQAAATVQDTGTTAEALDLARIVRENQAMVYSIAYHFLHDRALAEELAQDVFLQLHQNLNRIESEAHATRWLRKVASHRCIDYGRRAGHGMEVELDKAPEPRVEPASPDPLLRERLRKLVASLPEKKRLLVILRYQEEMSPDEIAKVVGMPSRTVRTQLFRALALLREKAAHFLGASPLSKKETVQRQVSEGR